MGRILPERTARPRTAPLAIAGAAAAIFVVAMSIVTLLTWASYRSLHDARIATLVARTDADLSFATSLLERTYAEIAGDVAVTAAAPSVQAAVAGDATTRAAGTTYLRRIVATYGRYARIRLVDADGREALHVVRNGGGARAVPPRTSPDLDRAARVAAAVAAPAGRLVLTDVATPDADAAHGDGAVVLVGFAMRLPPTPGVPPHVLSVEFDATPLVRRVFDVLRGIDMLIWSLIFIRAFGLGPLTGALAIAFTDTGSLGKLFSEALENVDDKQIEGVHATGASQMQRYRFGVIPQILPVFLSQGLYFLESNVRSATIIGALGAGGIGLMLVETMRTSRDWENTLYIIILTILVVFAMDAMSGWLRRRLIHGREAA
jgi:ABC-type proline/glycine betaine transport system permease subunit